MSDDMFDRGGAQDESATGSESQRRSALVVADARTSGGTRSDHVGVAHARTPFAGRIRWVPVKPLSRRLLLVLFTVICSFAGVASPSFAGVTSADPGTGTLGHQGRFYTVNHQPAALLGLNMQELAANPQIDYVSVLNAMQANQVKMVGLWIYPAWQPAGYLQPWTYGVCAPGKFDLDSWNPAYWARLKAFVDAAQARGIYVGLSLFPSNYVDRTGWNSPSLSYAYNANYNCNGEFPTNTAGTFAPQFWNSDPLSEVHIRQQQLVDKVLATFPYSSYPNLFFEVANEFPGRNNAADPSGSNTQANPALPEWQNGWINYIKANTPGRVVEAYAQTYVGTNTIGIENYWDQPNVDILNFHNTYADGEGVAAQLDSIGANLKGKILQDNETTGNEYGDVSYTDRSTQRAWAWNINLGYFQWYWDNSQLAVSPQGIEDPQFAAALHRINVMADIDNQVDWTDLSDQYNANVVQSPASHYRLLANPTDHRALYYGWSSNLDQPLQISLTSGGYLYQWINPQDGSVLAKGLLFTSGGVNTIAQPSAWNTTAGVVLTAVPATKDACKNGGWMTFARPTFDNQGACVSYVATGGTN